MLTDALLVAHREREDVVQIDAPVHIVDVKAKIIRINLDGIKPAPIERLCLGIRLYLLDVAAPVL